MRPGLEVLGLAGLLALAPAASAPFQHDGPSGQDADTRFAAGVREAWMLVRENDWSAARETVEGLLEGAESSPAAWRHRPELLDVLGLAAFFEGREPIDFRALVSGDVSYYSSSGGTIKITYDRRRLDDFMLVGKDGLEEWDGRGLADDSRFVHPIRFAGRHTVTVRGTPYPQPDWDLVPGFLVCEEDLAGVFVGFGHQRRVSGAYERWTPAAIRLFGVEDVRTLDSKDDSPCKPGKKYSLRVEVTESSIIASYNGRKFLRGKKPRDQWGRIGIFSCPGIEEIVLEGKAEPAWIQGLVDAELQRAWDAYREEHPPGELLPEALRLEPLEWEVPTTADDLPRDSGAGARIHLERLLECLAKSKPGICLGLARTGAVDTSAGYRAWAEALARAARDEHEEALEALAVVLEHDPCFPPAHRVRAEVLAEAQGLEAAEEALEEALSALPGVGWVHARLARLALWRGELGEAAARIEASIEAAAYDARVDSVNSLLCKARNGPAFTDPVEYASDHYVLRTDLDRRTAIEASRILESAYARFSSDMGAVPDTGERFAVYLFSGEASYRRYAADVLEDEVHGTLGVYSPALGQLLIWNVPRREDMLRTVRHEGFHQYLDQLAPGAPRWLHEGLAEYWEAADFSRLASRAAPVREDHLIVLKHLAQKRVPLARLLRGGASAFSRAELAYPQAWAFVHFLRHGPEEHRGRIPAYVAALREGSSTRDAFDAAFEGVDLAALEREVDRHLAGLRD